MVRPGRYGLVYGVISEDELAREVAEAMGELQPEEVDSVLEDNTNPITQGELVKGIVRGFQNDDVIVDINYKTEGSVPLLEFLNEGLPVIGSEIEIFLEEYDEEDGRVVLSKRKADRIKGWETILNEKDIDDVVTGKVIRKIKGGLLVDIGVPVFLPASQVDFRRTGDVSEFIGKSLECKIIKIDKERRNIVLSRRKLLEEERDHKKKKVLQTIEAGQIVRGIVKNITDFGAFVDLGGIDGLLHITDMSWGRVSHPSEVVKIDQEIEVKILNLEIDRERISLGLKQVQPSPWDDIEGRYPVNSRHKGPVVNIMPYGCFVKLEDGIEGLVHISEMSWTRQVGHPSEIVNPGDEVEVMILDINRDKQELSLGMKQCEDNPWDVVEEKYPEGRLIKGIVRNMTNYGAFIELEEGIDGLLHVNDMSWTKKIGHPSAVLNKGEEIEAVVLNVDSERKRVALGLKQMGSDPWEEHVPEHYHVGDVLEGEITKLTNFGAFVELENDLEGLLHISEMADHKVEKPEEVVDVDDKVEVMIINIDKEERKIGLSLRKKL
jgi:small subunit ribosomal protein S1